MIFGWAFSTSSKRIGKRPVPDGVGEVPTFFVAHIPRRCADHLRDRVCSSCLNWLFKAGKGLFGVKEVLGQFFGQESLPHAGGAGKKEEDPRGFASWPAANPTTPARAFLMARTTSSTAWSCPITVS